MSVISNLANSKRIEENAKRDSAIQSCENMLVDFLKKCVKSKFPFWHFSPEAMAKCFDNIIDSWYTPDWPVFTTPKIILRATNRIFGDPLALLKHQLQLRQHATQYYNPTVYPIRVEPMGLPDEDGKIIEWVTPGGLVKIPFSYLVGGRKSTLATTAPQLRPMPRVEPGLNLLDTTPQSFNEWITYYSCTTSVCCCRVIQWSDKLQSLVCSKCFKQADLTTGVHAS